MIRTETELDQCRQLWEQFSPHEDAWDDWDLMYAFHDPERHALRFQVCQEEGEAARGLIPLVHDSVNNRHTLIAGSYPDGRILWIEYDDFPAFAAAFPERTVFFDLREDWVDGLLEKCPQFAENWSEQAPRYLLRPAEFGFDFSNHLDLLGAEKKQKFLYDLRNIRKREPVLEWSEDDEASLFIDLVNRNFGAESDYHNEKDANEVRRVVSELKSSGRLRTLTIAIEGEKQAVSLSLLHNNRMVALYAASNNDYNNLGKLLNVETIQAACRLGVDEISYMTGMRWKAQWKMQEEACVTFRQPPAPWTD